MGYKVSYFSVIFLVLTDCTLFGEIHHPNIVSGEVQIKTQDARTQIYASDQSIIQFQKFDILPNETVEFIQPSASSRVLNRITGPNPSSIEGTLQANGIVYLINPAGIIFGPHSIVNAADFFAAAAKMDDRDYLQGVYRFTDITGTIIQDGRIEASSIALIGKEVRQIGTIVGTQDVVTIATEKNVLIGSNESRLFVKLEAHEIENTSLALGAGDLYSLAVAGKIIAKAMHIEGDQVEILGNLDASSKETNQNGGEIKILGTKIALKGATIDVSGNRDGGIVLIGGEYQGQGNLRKSDLTWMDQKSSIRADSIMNGNGGKVILWSDGTTIFDGTISTKGGEYSGDGGIIETSGKKNLGSKLGIIDTNAPQGKPGLWLLDPEILNIDGGADPYDPSMCDTMSAGTVSVDPSIFDVAGDVYACASSEVNISSSMDINSPDSITFQTDPGGSITVDAGITVNIAIPIGITTGTLNLNATLSYIDSELTLNCPTINMGASFISTTANGTITFVPNPTTISMTGSAGTRLINSDTINNFENVTVSDSASPATHDFFVSCVYGFQVSKSIQGRDIILFNGNDDSPPTTRTSLILSGSWSLSPERDLTIGPFNNWTRDVDATNYAVQVQGSGSKTITSGRNQDWRGALDVGISGAGATLTTISTAGNITFNNAVNSSLNPARGLIVTASSGTVTFTAPIGMDVDQTGPQDPLGSLSITGASIIVNATNALDSSLANINTDGAVNFSGPTTIQTDTTITTSNDAITFSGTVNGSTANTQTLTLSPGSGVITFGGIVGGSNRLNTLTATSTGGININTTGITAGSGGAVFTGPITLGANPIISTSTNNGVITFSGSTSTINGAYNLALTAGSGAITFNGKVGNTTPLTSLSPTSSSGITINTDELHASGGTMTYTGPVILTSDTTFTDTGGTGITFTSTITGNYNLTIDANTSSTADVIVGGTINLTGGSAKNLTVTAGNDATFSGAISSSGGNIEITATNGSITVQNITTTSSGNITLQPNDTLDGDQLPLGVLKLYGTDLETVSGTISLSALGRSELPAVATIYGNSSSENNITLTAATVTIGNYETTTSFGNFTIEATTASLGGDIMAVDQIAVNVVLGGNSNIFLRNSGQLLDSFGVLYDAPEVSFISLTMPDIANQMFSGSGEAADIGVPDQYTTRSAWKNALLYGATPLSYNNAAPPPPPSSPSSPGVPLADNTGTILMSTPGPISGPADFPNIADSLPGLEDLQNEINQLMNDELKTSSLWTEIANGVMEKTFSENDYQKVIDLLNLIEKSNLSNETKALLSEDIQAFTRPKTMTPQQWNQMLVQRASE